jgi:hypothetical protein
MVLNVWTGQILSPAANFTLSKPFVYGDAREPGELSREFHMRQAVREEVINRADRHAESRGELALGLKIRFFRSPRHFGCIIYAHFAFLAGALLALRVATMRIHLMPI